MHIRPVWYHGLMNHPALQIAHSELISLPEGKTQQEALTGGGRVVLLIVAGTISFGCTADTLGKGFTQVLNCCRGVHAQSLACKTKKILFVILKVAEGSVVLRHLTERVPCCLDPC